jgi:hypothetical protein
VLYGTTTSGGELTACSGYGCGTVFGLVPPASPGGEWRKAVLHSFTGGSDGANPAASLIIDTNGVLYGTAPNGGASTACAGYGCGTVFKLAPPPSQGGTWAETVLYSFTNENGDGAIPIAGLALSQDGALYGTTTQSGEIPGCHGYGCGTVFMLMPPPSPGGAWTETVLHRFKSTDGAYPEGVLVIGKNGLLYGTTTYGGTSMTCASSLRGCGTVFELRP